jgi:hypothetical protein
VDRLKTEKIEELKAAGIEYEERMAKLEEVEHPKPLREFLYDTFNAFAAAHPWVEQENVRPKSIAREMFERYLSFADYIREYGLERARACCCATFRRSGRCSRRPCRIPPRRGGREMEDYFRELIRGIDSSLLEEWERMKDPDWVATEVSGEKPVRPSTFDITRDQAAFRRLVRAEILRWLQDVARGVDGGSSTAGGEAEDVRERESHSRAFEPYWAERGRFRLDPEGRAVKHTHWTETSAEQWTVAQMLADGQGLNDWEAVFTVPLAESRTENRAVIRFVAVRPVGSS